MTINILGTNDAAVLSSDTGNLTETNSAPPSATSGTLTISDVDSPATFVAQAGTGGQLRHVLRSTRPAPGPTRRARPTTSSWPAPLHRHLRRAERRRHPDLGHRSTSSAPTTRRCCRPTPANLTETNSAADISTSGTLTISDVDSPATFVAQAGTAGTTARSRSMRPAPGPTRRARPTTSSWPATTYTDTFDGGERRRHPHLGDHQHPRHQRRGGAVGRHGNLTETNSAADISTSGTLTISDVDSPATFVAQAGTAGTTARSRSMRPAPGPTRPARPTTSSWPAPPTPTPSRGERRRHPTSVTVNILGTNDAAVLSADTPNLTETNAAADISHLRHADHQRRRQPGDLRGAGRHRRHYGTFAIDAAGAWTYTASSAHDEFVAGTTYTDTFAVASADGTATSVTVNILGTNDAAVLSADTPNLTETNAAADISTSRHADHQRRRQPGDLRGAGRHGRHATARSRSMRPAPGPTPPARPTTSSWPAPPTPTPSRWRAADGTPTSVTVNILGTNDAAVLSADTANLTETNSAAAITTSGTLTISDVDSPATFVAQAGTAGSYGTFAIDAAGAWTYTASSAHDEFVAGTTYTDTFAVPSADGTRTSVTVNILGTNDAAVLSADSRT